jgi:DNA-binding transcriptional LysR family regulator
MDIKGLRYFIAAAERLNFTTAAKECYITQTAMSLHISKMETELGFKLFDRNKRVVELTDAGKDFLRYARTLLIDYSQAVQHSTGIAIGQEGTITVMIPSLMEGTVFLEHFRNFLTDYPDVTLNIKVENPGKMVGALKKGRIDLAISPPYEMEIDPDIQTVVLRRDPGMLIVSKQHPFATDGKTVTAALLEEENFIVTLDDETPATFRMVRKKWRESGFELRHYTGVQNMDEMLMLVELNKAIGIVPEFVRQSIRPNGGICVIDNVEYEGHAPELITAIGYLIDSPNPVVDNLLKYMQER